MSIRDTNVAAAAAAAWRSIFGYFDRAGQGEPTYDPGPNVLCPVCLRMLSDPVRTVSMVAAHAPQRSYFYRLRKVCHENAADDTLIQIESAVIEAEATLMPNRK